MKKVELPARLAKPEAKGGVVSRWVGVTAPLEAQVVEVGFSPENPESRVAAGEDFDQLKASLSSVGVLQPLTVIPVDAWVAAHPDHVFDPEVAWVVAAGNRRLAAARAVGLSAVPVFVREDMAARSVEMLLHENKVRLELSPLDEAVAYQDLIAKGMTQRQIAEPLGISQGTVSKRLQLLTLPAALQGALAEERVTLQEALWLLNNYTADELAEFDVTGLGAQTLASLGWKARQIVQHRQAVAAAEAAAAAEQLELVNPNERWGQRAHDHRLYQKADIAKARKAGDLVVAPGRDGEVAYYTTAKPARATGNSEAEQLRAVKAATKAREPWAKARARRAYTQAQLQARLLDLVLSGHRVDAETQVIAMRLAEDDPPPRADVYRWVDAQMADRKLRERLGWLYSWAAIELRSRHAWSTWSADVRAYIDLLVEDGHTLSQWERDRYESGFQLDRVRSDSTESDDDSVESQDDEGKSQG